jgi:hypothetical protein
MLTFNVIHSIISQNIELYVCFLFYSRIFVTEKFNRNYEIPALQDTLVPCHIVRVLVLSEQVTQDVKWTLCFLF